MDNKHKETVTTKSTDQIPDLGQAHKHVAGLTSFASTHPPPSRSVEKQTIQISTHNKNQAEKVLNSITSVL